MEWRAKFKGIITHIIHYLDDFLILAPPGSSRCRQELEGLLAMFGRLQVPVAAEKVEGPSPQMVFLGIEINTSKMCLRLPSKKLDNLKTMVADWFPKKSCLIRDLQSLVGSYSMPAKWSGLEGLSATVCLSCSKGIQGTASLFAPVQPSGWIYCGGTCFWSLGMEYGSYRGSLLAYRILMFIDASGSFRVGAWFNVFWFQLPWPQAVVQGQWSIAAKELTPIVVATALWGNFWRARLF